MPSINALSFLQPVAHANANLPHLAPGSQSRLCAVTGLLRLCAFTGILCLCACDRSPSHPQSLLVITLDTTRADHLEVYGYSRPTTPVLESLAAKGLRFDRAYAPINVTTPSHITLFTSQPPLEHGVRANIGDALQLPERALTLAEHLSARGFETAGFVGASTAGSDTGLQQGFSRFGEPDYEKGAERKGSEVTDEALEWLRQRSRDRPFFLWVHYFDPHGPYNPPESHLEEVGPGPGPQKPSGAGSARDDVRRYDGELHYVDAQVGRILEAVERLGPTLVSILADHGETLDERVCGFYHGHHLYEEQMHIPWILSGPGVPRATVIDTPVRMIDVAPTLLSAMGVQAPNSFRGRDLWPRIRKGYNPKPLPIFLETGVCEPARCSTCWPRGIAGKKLGVRWDRFKLVRTPASEGVEFSLFDLERDPGERTNLASSRPDLLKQGSTLLADHFSQGPYSPGYPRETGFHPDPSGGGGSAAAGVGDHARAPPDPNAPHSDSPPDHISSEARERLKALGYSQ